MIRRSQRLAVLAAVLCLLSAVPAYSQENMWTLGGSCGVLLKSDGTMFFSNTTGHTCVAGQDPWVTVGNLFALAGHGGGGRVVGVNSAGNVLSAAGDEYQVTSCSSGGVGATFVYNVFEFTGLSPFPGESFEGFGSGNLYAYAVTSSGRVFRKLMTGCDPQQWQYVGAFESGPVEAKRTSWGELKMTYR